MIFDARTLAQFRRTQEASMMHECTIEAYTVGEDGTISYGAPVTGVPCGFRVLEHTASGTGPMYDVIEADAEIRLPLNISVGLRDRVTLTKSFDQVLNPAPHFEVGNLPDGYGPSGQVIRLKEVYA